MMSASLPSSMEPLRSKTPIIFAGVSLAMRNTSIIGMSAFLMQVRMSTSMVAIDPARTERSANLQTPSSIITRASASTSPSLAAYAKESVIRAVFSTPFIL